MKSQYVGTEDAPEEASWGLDLTHYGPSRALYKGEGVLTLAGRERVECAFEAGQLTSGDVILLCATNASSPLGFGVSASAFSGTTADGHHLSAEGRITELTYLPDTPHGRSGTWAAFRLDRLVVRSRAGGPLRSVRFGITNFMFTCMATAAGTDGSQVSVLPLRLESGEGVTSLHFRPVEQYEKVMRRVQTLKGIDVTCEAVAESADDADIERLEGVADNLCRILSVARGTKIQWVYRDCYDAAGGLVSRTHYGHVTKPYAPMAVIDPRYQGRDETRSFIEGAYPVYVERRDAYKLDRGTVDAYLDAKAENDYLEMRGGKLAVALEKLKAVFLAQPGGSAKEFVIAETKFAELMPKLKEAVSDVLKEADVPSSARGEMYGKLRGFNRRSFADLLGDFFDSIGLRPSGREVQLFIQCRNKLVHAGEFYCVAATADERDRCEPFPSPREEYYFMVNFLDRIFLRMLGYSGQYFDYRTIIPGPLGKGEL